MQMWQSADGANCDYKIADQSFHYLEKAVILCENEDSSLPSLLSLGKINLI